MKKTKETLEGQHENFIAAVRKKRNASTPQGKNERQSKQAYRNSYDISSIKRV